MGLVHAWFCVTVFCCASIYKSHPFSVRSHPLGRRTESSSSFPKPKPIRGKPFKEFLHPCFAFFAENFPGGPDDHHDDSPSPSTRRDGTGNDNNDWIQAELTIHNFPHHPSPDLSPELVLLSCLRSLQFIDHPAPSSGLQRIFPFFTWECRKIVTARQGGDTVERFMQYGLLSPALQPFMGATRIDIGEGTLTSSVSATRGDIFSYPVTVHGSLALSFRHSSGFIKDGVSAVPPVTNMVVRLERNRRPPLQGCWLVREVLDVRHAFAGDMGNAHVGG